MSVKIRIDPGEAGGGMREVSVALPVVTIGRDPSCSVVLVDPSKHVSRFHATIHRRDGSYQLTVGSKVNPVEVNGRPCAFGQSVTLADGDTLAIPPFVMTFNIVADDDATSVSPRSSAPNPAVLATPAAAAMPSPFDDILPAATPQADPLDLGNLLGATPQQAATPTPDPFELPAAAPTNKLADGVPGKADDYFSEVQAPVDPMAALERKSSRATSANAFGFDLNAFSVDEVLEPGPSHSGGGGASGSLAESLPNPLVDLGDPRSRRGTDAPDHVHDFNLPFTPPPIASPPPAAESTLVARPPLAADPTLLSGAAAPSSDPTLLGGAVARPSAEATLFETARPSQVAAPPAARPVSPPLDQTMVEQRVARAGSNPFLQGLGLDSVTISPAEEAAFLRLAGEITRTAVEGIMALLSSRGEVKKELRAPDRTMLAAHNNNPLKLMADAREAITFLFDPSQRPTGAFMGPAQAMQDACDDILAHEIGLVAGTRAAVEGSIRRFDPAKLEQLAENDKGGGLLSNRRARLWDLYVERYRQVELDLADNIDRLFERDFLRAYTEQVRRLRRRS